MKMVKIKTADLIGAQLDWAVARSLNIASRINAVKTCDAKKYIHWERWTPSIDWIEGGPIIERERIELSFGHGSWSANLHPWGYDPGSYGLMDGATPLIAAMRAFVASKLGDEVEVPEVLA